jgi:hypothetical protein
MEPKPSKNIVRGRRRDIATRHPGRGWDFESSALIVTRL